MNIKEKAKLAKKDSHYLWSLKKEDRDSILLRLSEALVKEKKEILKANQKDLINAKTKDFSPAFSDRLKLDEKRIEDLASSVKSIQEQEDFVFRFEDENTRKDGLVIKKQRIPLGLIGIVFESRPNVIIDCFSLGIKSGNAMFLKGGKESLHTNLKLMEIAHQSLGNQLPVSLYQILMDRKEAMEMMELSGIMDLIIPRGSEKLIQYVREHSKVPVIFHEKGLCHLYIDKDVDFEEAIKITLNSKMQRSGVCNALETLLVHKEIAESDSFLNLLESLKTNGCTLRLDKELYHRYPNYEKATEEDWDTEYLDAILSIKMVQDIEQAIDHINQYGSHHTEAICSSNKENVQEFLNQVDASCIMVNASTRFNDGGELGLGAEVGISTSKLHSYGPMGAKDLTTTRYVVEGKGHLR